MQEQSQGKRDQENYAEGRLGRLREMLREHDVDAVLVSNPTNIFYLTGFKGVEPQEREAYALVTPSRTYFITRELYYGQAPEDSVRKDILHFVDVVKEISHEEDIKTIGIEEDNLTVREYRLLREQAGLDTRNVPVKQLRLHKTPEEIELIKEACDAGDRALEYILSKLRTGITETELRDELEAHMKGLGYVPAFPTIIAFGEHAGDPHYQPEGNSQLEEGSYVLIDWGLTGKEGYSSDSTRTVFYGDPTEEQIHRYKTVQEAQQKVIDRLTEYFADPENLEHGSLSGKEVDAIARDHILEAGYPAERFSHGLGHGIGVEVHEPPMLNAVSEDKIEKGVVFSDEPGIYDERGGVRIEDLIAITDNGVEVLTHSPKNLRTIEPNRERRQPQTSSEG
jgi:Xaa-Pro aminopeptidase